MRAGEQFLARGRVPHIPDASGTDVDGIWTFGFPETVGNTDYLLESYKNNRTKEE